MGYESYRPEFLAKELMVQRGRESVFKNLTYKGPILGEITQKGDHLKIAGVGRPTVRDFDPGTDIVLERKGVTNQDLYITQAKYVNVVIDRVAKKQNQNDVMNTEISEARLALAESLDSYLAGFYSQAGNTLEDTACTSASILSTLAEAEQALLEENVPLDEERFLVISPAVYTKLVLGKIVFQQTNEKVFGKGFKGGFLNFNVHVSNAIKKTGDVNHCMAFTRKTLAMLSRCCTCTAEPSFGPVSWCALTSRPPSKRPYRKE
jgi:hypothetical protein